MNYQIRPDGRVSEVLQGSRSRGLPHGPAGDSITRHQEVLSNTLSSGLLICGRIGPVAGVPAGNQMTFTCASVQGRPVSADVADGTSPDSSRRILRQSAWHLARSGTSGLRDLVIRACHRRRYTAGT